MDEKTKRILEEILPKIRDNPERIRGYDISQKELSQFKKTGKIPFDLLSLVAWDHYFEARNEELDISMAEATKIRDYLTGIARYNESEQDELINEFDFIVTAWDDYEGTTDWI